MPRAPRAQPACPALALRGATALSLARKFKPAAVTLNIELPYLDGWKVLDTLIVRSVPCATSFALTIALERQQMHILHAKSASKPSPCYAKHRM